MTRIVVDILVENPQSDPLWDSLYSIAKADGVTKCNACVSNMAIDLKEEKSISYVDVASVWEKLDKQPE
jgi:hypothetical protein